jgi:hypothetical protein
MEIKNFFLNKKNIPYIIIFVGLILIFSAALISKINFPKNIFSGNKNFLPIERDLEISKNPAGFAVLWWTDFNNNRVLGMTPDGKIVWQQNMNAAPIPQESWYHIGGIENVSVASNGNLIAVHGDGMMVQEIDRNTHNLVWQYGKAGIQTYRGGTLDEPDKSFKINDHEVLINDGNDREVIVVDQKTNQVVWQYGEYHKMGSAPGLLRGNTSVRPLNGGKEFLITDTLEKKIMIVDRASKNIVWAWQKPDAEWLQNVFATKEETFVLEDRIKGEVFEVNREGKILWTLDKLSDENRLTYPTDTAKLENGNVLIAEAGKSRIVEAVPATGQIVRQYLVHGLITTIAIDQKNLDLNSTLPGIDPKNLPQTIAVDDAAAGNNHAKNTSGGSQTISGKVVDVNASTSRAGAFNLKSSGTNYGVQVYNYSRVINKKGHTLNLATLEKGDEVFIRGTISGTFIQADLVQDKSK